MSLRILATGSLIKDPEVRVSKKGSEYLVASLRVPADEDSLIVSVLSFSDSAVAQVRGMTKGDSLAVVGTAKLTSWTGKDGANRTGLSVTADQVLTLHAERKRRPEKQPERTTSRAHRADPEFNDRLTF